MAAKFAAVVLFALYFIAFVDASHFRSAITRISVPDPVNYPLTMLFEVDVAFRRSYPIFIPPYTTRPAEQEDVMGPWQESNWNFDDGSYTQIYWKISSINVQEDWFVGRISITKTYGAPNKGGNPYKPNFTTCCRISTLHNAHDTDFIVQLQFDATPRLFNGQLRPNNSPVIGTNPLVRLSNEDIFRHTIVVHDPENDPISFRLGTATECGAGHVQPPNFTVNSVTGEIVWDVRTLALGLWNACILISDPYSTVNLDFILELRQAIKVCSPLCDNAGQVCLRDEDCCDPFSCVPNALPYFIAPTPSEGETLTVLIGQEISVTITAKDNNTNDVVTIGNSVVPPGAVLGAQTGSNPSSRVLTWTPTTAGSEVVCVVAYDQHGLGVAEGQHCFVINVIDEVVRCEDPLGGAQNFGVFAIEDITWVGANIQGRVAAGGNAVLSGVTVGCSVNSDLGVDGNGCANGACAAITGAGRDANTLIVGGNIDSTTSRVATGNAVYGGALTGTLSTVSDCGSSQDADAVDFAEYASYLQDISLVNRDRTATGYYVQYLGGKITAFAAGAVDNLAVFQIPAAHLASATEVEVDGAAANTTVIFNVAGGSGLSFGNMGFVNVNAKKTIWNFYEATSITLSFVDWQGSILAPLASFTATTGQVNGQVFVKSLSCTGACSTIKFFDAMTFEGCLPIRHDGGPPPQIPEHTCSDNWQCGQEDALSICGGQYTCECIFGATGSFPECACDSPKEIIWINGIKNCLEYPQCSEDWQCHSGEVCDKPAGEPLGVCKFQCNWDWQCSDGGSFRVCDTSTESCACVYGATNHGSTCTCDAPNRTVWQMGKPYCLSATECFAGWQCSSGSCNYSGSGVGTCN